MYMGMNHQDYMIGCFHQLVLLLDSIRLKRFRRYPMVIITEIKFSLSVPIIIRKNKSEHYEDSILKIC